MKKVEEKRNVILYQTTSGSIELRGDSKAHTLWATQAQIAQAFNVNVPTINEHIKNIYKTKELSEKATIRKIRIVQHEGKRLIERDVNHYNLDLIISVGYRVNSIKATKFRQWATKVLKQHVTDGYTINKKVLLKNYDQFIQTVTNIQTLLPKDSRIDSEAVLELIKSYAVTWAKLDAYDRDLLQSEGTNKKKIRLQGQELTAAIATLKKELSQNQQATEIFAQERERGAVEGIIGNVMQTFNGTDLYQTLESKAAHLLYFMVKNHPFVDGNKRAGAFSFIWFLRRNGVKGIQNINPQGLTVLTLLIAESDPNHKEKMIALVVELLQIHRN